MRRQVQRVLDAVSAEQRSLLQLAYFDGLSAVEIADRSSLSAASVRGQLADALRCLRTGLFWIEAPHRRPRRRARRQYLLGELSSAERAALRPRRRVAGLDGATTTSVRDSIHSLALYTLPGPSSPRIRARLLAAVTGPDRMQPFAVDLARFFVTSTSTPPASTSPRRPPPRLARGRPGVRLLSINLGADPRVLEDSDVDDTDDALLTTMVQSPAWPSTCLVRVAPGHRLGARYPRHRAEALVLQGSLVGGDGTHAPAPASAGAGPPGRRSGTASAGEVELICAVRAGAAQA
jgi:hypothetical protein